MIFLTNTPNNTGASVFGDKMDFEGLYEALHAIVGKEDDFPTYAVSDASYTRMINLMNKDYSWVDGYATQYVDILNCRFIDTDKEKRMKRIPTMAKRLAEYGVEYKQVENAVLAAAKEYVCPVTNIGPNVDYPGEIEW